MRLTETQKDKKRGFLFNIDWVEYVEILKDQKGFILVFCTSAILTSLALTYILTEKFDAATTLYYRPVQSSVLRQKSTQSFGAPPPAPPFKVINQTLLDMIHSPVILEPVVKKLHLDKEEEVYYSIWYERWYNEAKDLLMEFYAKSKMILQYGRIIEEDPVLSAIQGLVENIDITATKDSYIYVLKMRDKHPKRAALIVDTAGNEMVSWIEKRDHLMAKKSSVQFQELLSETDNQLITLRSKREELLNKYNIVSVPDEASKSTASLYDMEQDIVELKAKIYKKQKRIDALKLELQTTIKGLINPDDKKKMASDKLFESIELQGLNAMMDSLQSSIEDLRVRTHKLPNLEKSINNLDMLIGSSIREREQFKDLHLESFIESISFQSEIRLLHPAVSTGAPVQPIKIYHVGLSALLSLSLSIGMVYVFAYFNIRTFFASKGKKERGASETGKLDVGKMIST